MTVNEAVDQAKNAIQDLALKLSKEDSISFYETLSGDCDMFAEAAQDELDGDEEE